MAKIYYRSIIGERIEINDVPTKWVDAVKALFKADVQSGKISIEYYEEKMKEKYDP